eukprot:UN21786
MIYTIFVRLLMMLWVIEREHR